MSTNLDATYRGKKIFLTGHTGFKGSWLLKTLDLLGADVKGYALAPQNSFDLYNVINGDEICSSVIGDIRDRNTLITAIKDYQPDFVFHLAAQPLVRLSYEIPSATFDINAIGTANLLDAINLLDKKCNVVLITTDKVYHNNEWVYPYRENDRLGGYDPYSASKACAEIIIDSYRNSFFNTKSYDSHHKAIAVARAGNVIGGGDWATDRLIPDIVRALSKKDTVQIRNPKSIRPWQHVLEPVIGYLLLGAKLAVEPRKFSEAYNFGPNPQDSLPVSEMVDVAIQLWGSGNAENVQLDSGVHEAGLLKLDINKALTELNWQPTFNARSAIEKTVSWYKTYLYDENNILSFTEGQIMQFLKP